MGFQLAFLDLRYRNWNAQAQRNFRHLLRLVKPLFDPADYSLRGLNLFAILFIPRNPDVDKFVAKQLIGGEREQYPKFLNGQLQGTRFGDRLVPDFLSSATFWCGGTDALSIAGIARCGMKWGVSES